MDYLLIYPTSAKGQISIEYLLLFVLFLLLLSISLTVLLDIREKSEKLMAQKYYEVEARKLEHAINEVCLLGNGNKREVRIEKEVEVGEGKVKGGEYEYKLKVYCEIEGGKVSGRVVVENVEGKVRLRPL